MAKKAAPRRKAQSNSVVSRIQSGVKKMQQEAKTLLSRARKEAVRLSGDQKRTLDRALRDARRLRSDFEKTVKRTSKDLESRSRTFLSTLEKDVEKRLEPIVNRLIGPSRQEVQSLAWRVHELEQHLKQHEHAEPSAGVAHAASTPPDAVEASAGD